MAEHQPRYPPEAYAAPDTAVTSEQYARLYEHLARLVAHYSGRIPLQGGVRRDGWQHYATPGLPFATVQLPPVVEDVP